MKMPRIVSILSLLVCLVAAAWAEGWEWLIPQPQGNNLADIQFVSGQVGWIGGSRGCVLRTTDAGQIWASRNIEADFEVYIIRFTSESRGWLIGNRGRGSDPSGWGIHHTTDAGETWVDQTVLGHVSISDMVFSDSLHGWIAGMDTNWSSMLLRTTDGGETWTPTDTDTMRGIEGVHFFDQDHGWIAGENGLAGTTNGGESWTFVYDTTLSHLRQVFFLDRDYGWISSSDGWLHRTTDGGINWTRYSISGNIADMGFSTPALGYACAINGSVVWCTQDSGQTWIEWAADWTEYWPMQFRGVSHLSDSTFWLVGKYGMMAYTTDAGINWSVSSGPHYPKANRICLVDSTRLWAVGDDGFMMYSGDGGRTWSELQTGVTEDINDVYFIDEDNGWFVCAQETYHSTDGGATWELNHAWGNNFMFARVTFVNDLCGWIAGGRWDDYREIYYSSVFRTTDGGQSWSEQWPEIVYALIEIVFSDENYGWCLTDASLLSRTSDGGQTWTWMPQGFHLAGGIHSMGYDTCWVACEWLYEHEPAGSYMTTDGGQNWQLVEATDYHEIYNDVVFNGIEKGVYVAYNQTRHTMNGGQTWVTYPFIGVSQVHGQTVIAPNGEVWRIIGGGRILHFMPPTANQINMNHNTASIQQCELYSFPNPFNSRVAFNYSIPNAGETHLEVFDITGRLVQTVEHRFMYQGKYSATFDGSHVASGIYFARLKGKDFVATKKIILLK